MTPTMELIDLVPNSLSFRVISTVDITDEAEIPEGFTGRVRFHRNDRVEYVAWYVDGLLQNPGRRDPAYRRFRADGSLKYEMYYVDGLLHDAPDGEPAVRGWFTNGAVHYEERWRGGRRQDGKQGTAAVRKWRADGTLRHELHFVDGRRLTTRNEQRSPLPPSPPRPAARQG